MYCKYNDTLRLNGSTKHISYINSDGCEINLDTFETNKYCLLGLDDENEGNEFLLELFELWLENYTCKTSRYN